jgi:hypothetical protein
MTQKGTTVTSKNGVAQWRATEGMVSILFNRYTMFLNDDEVGELIGLLEAIQQEIDLKLRETVDK